MLEIKKVDKIESLAALKAQYFAQTVAPLDGMWHFGFVPETQHFGFYEKGTLIGFCCINDDGYLLQYYLSPKAETSSSELFTLIAQQNSSAIGVITGAFVSTADSIFLSLCLDSAASVSVNSLLYCGYENEEVRQSPSITLSLATEDQLNIFVDFAIKAIGAPREWLASYFGHLISRHELFGYWQEDQLCASGECRKFDDYQTEYADLGMIVSPDFRGQGIATEVLRALIVQAITHGLTPMCSTEKSNIAAQRAISKAGLSTKHRIVQVLFELG